MKIGILTLPLHTNYGGILQAYALQTVLERMGHEVVVIDRNEDLKLNFWERLIVYPYRLIKKYVLGKEVIVNFEKFFNLYRHFIRKNTDVFIKEHIHRIYIKKFSEVNYNEFDAVVVGSDQIWRYDFVKDYIFDVFLSFVKSDRIVKLAYACSFGIDEWNYPLKVTEKCRKLVRNFSGISVREVSGIQLCKKYLNIDATLVLDPTMLLAQVDYLSLIRGYKPHCQVKEIFCYILDRNPEIENFIIRVEKRTHLKSFSVLAEHDWNFTEDNIQPPVEEWLYSIANSKMIITDSFHACVFALIFNKPFVALGNSNRGQARFLSLLSVFGLKECLVSPCDDFKFLMDFNWNEVNKKCEVLRQKSLSYIVKSLNKK